MKKPNPAILIDPLYEPFDMSIDPDLYKELLKLYLELLSTFELRKAAWQMQSGLLFEAYPGCTHTRRAHGIGCWILGWHSLHDIKVVPLNSKLAQEISLKDWLKAGKKGDFTKEYLLSLLLHDIGHAPFSHALESNPFLDIDHEEIGRSLICNTEAEDKINYHVLLRYLLTIYKIRKASTGPKEYRVLYKKAKRQTKVVHNVLEGDAKTDVIGMILKGRDDDPRLYTLHELVDSEVDIDRIDHFLRDSYYSGIKFADYRVRGLLQNLVIVPKNTKEYEKISGNIQKKKGNLRNPPSYLMVKEEGIEQVEYLLTAREFIFDRVLFHPKNLMLIGALNMGIRLIVQYEPFIKTILPFLTDQILLQVFREDKFANTTIEGYERILRGEIPTEEFALNREFLLNPQVTSSSDIQEFKKIGGAPEEQFSLFQVFEKIEDFNSKSPTSPKIIVFSNLRKKRKNDHWWKNVISEKNHLPLGMGDNEKKLFEWLKNKETSRSNKIIIWHYENINLEKDVGLPKGFLKRELHE